MTQKIVNELNEVLLKAANDLKFTRKVSMELIDSLLSLSNDYSHNQILILEEELKRDAQEFLLFNRDELERYRSLEKVDSELQQEKNQYVKNKEFEKAALCRDKKRKIQEQILQEVLNLNSFNEGFNLYKGSLLIVKPRELNQATVIEKYLEMREEG